MRDGWGSTCTTSSWHWLLPGLLGTIPSFLPPHPRGSEELAQDYVGGKRKGVESTPAAFTRKLIRCCPCLAICCCPSSWVTGGCPWAVTPRVVSECLPTAAPPLNANPAIEVLQLSRGEEHMSANTPGSMARGQHAGSQVRRLAQAT